MAPTQVSTHAPCRNHATEGGSMAVRVPTEPHFIVHRVPQAKLQKAIKRTIEDEIPFLDTYTVEQKKIYQVDQMLRLSETDRMAKAEECFLYPNNYFHPKNCSAKNGNLYNPVHRTINDEIPYFFLNKKNLSHQL